MKNNRAKQLMVFLQNFSCKEFVRRGNNSNEIRMKQGAPLLLIRITAVTEKSTCTLYLSNSISL